jgi:hypothetical protein
VDQVAHVDRHAVDGLAEVVSVGAVEAVAEHGTQDGTSCRARRFVLSRRVLGAVA